MIFQRRIVQKTVAAADSCLENGKCPVPQHEANDSSDSRDMNFDDLFEDLDIPS